MKTRIVRIGNSRGVRLPKPLIEQAGLGEEVELRVEPGAIRILATSAPRAPQGVPVVRVEFADRDVDRSSLRRHWRDRIYRRS